MMDALQLTTDIQAPPGQVWEVLTALEDYPDWTDHYAFDGPLPVRGGQVRMHARQPNGKVHSVMATFPQIERHAKLVWVAGTRGLFRGEKTWRLESVGPSMTRLRMIEQFHGLIPLLAGKMLTRSFEAHYTAFCEQLKRRVEAQR
jgi:hypothetical protein